jgi:hypothetical protein
MMSQMIIKTITYMLLSLFVLDFVSAFVSVHAVISRTEIQQDEDQCGCTCCGDVCSMGSACCCKEESEKPTHTVSGVRIIQTDCQPNTHPVVLASIFSRAGVWLIPKIPSVLDMDKKQNQYDTYNDALLTRYDSPPTPPPQSHFFSLHRV